MRVSRLLTIVLGAAALILTPARAQDASLSAAIAALAEGDYETAEAALSPACKAGSADACWRLGLMLKGQYDEAAKARTQFLANCAKKDAKSCYMLAGMANQGEGGSRDEAQARTAYGKACELGLAFSCSSQALMLSNGDGGKEDKPGAARAYARGCELGSSAACLEAGSAYAVDPEAPDYDEARASAMYAQACDMGQVSGCSALASFGIMGSAERTPQEQRAAQALYEKACLGGESYACDTWLTGQMTLP